MSEKRPPHVVPQTVGELIAALQEFPDQWAIAVRTGTTPDDSDDGPQPIVRPVLLWGHSNRGGPYVTL